MLIKVNVTVGSKKRSVTKNDQDSYDVCVKSLPIQGRANEEVLGLVAKHFKTTISNVKVIDGHKKRKKVIKIA